MSFAFVGFLEGGSGGHKPGVMPPSWQITWANGAEKRAGKQTGLGKTDVAARQRSAGEEDSIKGRR